MKTGEIEILEGDVASALTVNPGNIAHRHLKLASQR